VSQKTCPDNNRLSLVGWGKSEGEELGTIFRVSQALRIFFGSSASSERMTAVEKEVLLWTP
jgi:hypothetical protein